MLYIKVYKGELVFVNYISAKHTLNVRILIQMFPLNAMLCDLFSLAVELLWYKTKNKIFFK
jgi:hypothetical protein